jgi:hypothetical protein
MLGQLSNVGESWSKATNEDEWLQTDAAEEKKTLTRTVRDARSWGQEALKKIREFREEATAWRRHNDSATSRYQEWEEGTDAGDTHIATVNPHFFILWLWLSPPNFKIKTFTLRGCSQTTSTSFWLPFFYSFY